MCYHILRFRTAPSGETDVKNAQPLIFQWEKCFNGKLDKPDIFNLKLLIFLSKNY